MGSGKKFVSLAQFGWLVKNRKRVLCFYGVIKTLVEGEKSKKLWKHALSGCVPTGVFVLPNLHSCFYNS